LIFFGIYRKFFKYLLLICTAPTDVILNS